MKKLLGVAGLAGAVGVIYVLRQKAAHEREERSIWAEVAASFDEYPEHGKPEVEITRVR